MRLTLFHKLLGTFAVATLASVVVFALITQISVGRNFLRYLNEVHNQRMAVLADSLAESFATPNGWDSLRNNPRAWRRQVAEASRDWQRDGSQKPKPPKSLSAPPKLRHLAPPALYNPAFETIAGDLPYNPDLQLTPVEVNGEVVAWIGAPPIKHPIARRDVDFVKRQGNALLGGAAAVLLLALMGAVLTARRLANPIRDISEGARALASGDFETRLPVHSRDEIGDLAADFNVLARTLQHNETARQRWIADISHELRTPLAIMRGEVDAARDGIRPNDQRLLDSLHQETERLQKLVEDLYVLARADVGSLDYVFEPCSLASLITESLNRFAHRLSDARLEYNYEIAADVSVNGDKRRLLEVIENLLENCVRYVHSPGQVAIRLARDNGNAMLSIDDSGPGVPDEMLATLFDPLVRGEQSRSREFGGAGLGLAICKRIIEGHDGAVTAEKSALGGFRVVLTLPLFDSNG